MATAEIFELNADAIDSFRRRKIIRETTGDDVVLQKPNPGEEELGKLTGFECEVWSEIVTLASDLEEQMKELSARSLEMIADAVRNTDVNAQTLSKFDMTKIFPQREDAEDYYSMYTRMELLRGIFWDSVRQRYGHATLLGIRTDFTVYRLGYKYTLPDEIK